MAAISDIHNVWRDSMVPASFRGAFFHVENSTRGGGRRTVVHQYPKRNVPYAEDMGREATRWNFSGYVIHGDHGFPGNVMTQVAALNRVLDADDAGLLVHPFLGSMLVMCEKWAYSDKRTQGGFFEYDMQFIEAGSPAMAGSPSAAAGLSGAVSNAETTATNNIAAINPEQDPSGGGMIQSPA